VTYCSIKCQSLHQKAGHDLECPIIATAHQGDIAQARNFFTHYGKAAIEENNTILALRALLWHQKTMVRIFQDRSLLKNPSTCTALKTVTQEHRLLVQQLIKNGIISTHYNLYELNKLALNWAEDLTINNQIVGPEGILAYIPSEITQNGQNLFVSAQEWKTRRRTAIIDIIIILQEN
jgi:hypothetical protein